MARRSKRNLNFLPAEPRAEPVIDISAYPVDIGVGELMRLTRERLGHELQSVANQLRIRLSYLEAIEEGRFRDLPGTTYAVGFVRSYADYLGLDGADIPLTSVTNVGDPRNNAGYYGNGYMVYLDGDGFEFGNFAGALDVVAHELTHGVTEFTWNGVYERESGALNEAFSDIIGTATEFNFQPAGTGALHADYLIGEDVITGGLRSLANPRAYGDPDHYSLRFRGAQDNGGVHTNSMIAGHAFYLAVEGGTNRTSGSRRTSRTRSYPESPGMSTSLTTRSGRSRRIRSSASVPSAASRTRYRAARWRAR